MEMKYNTEESTKYLSVLFLLHILMLSWYKVFSEVCRGKNVRSEVSLDQEDINYNCQINYKLWSFRKIVVRNVKEKGRVRHLSIFLTDQQSRNRMYPPHLQPSPMSIWNILNIWN